MSARIKDSNRGHGIEQMYDKKTSEASVVIGDRPVRLRPTSEPEPKDESGSHDPVMVYMRTLQTKCGTVKDPISVDLVLDITNQCVNVTLSRDSGMEVCPP